MLKQRLAAALRRVRRRFGERGHLRVALHHLLAQGTELQVETLDEYVRLDALGHLRLGGRLRALKRGVGLLERSLNCFHLGRARLRGHGHLFGRLGLLGQQRVGLGLRLRHHLRRTIVESAFALGLANNHPARACHRG